MTMRWFRDALSSAHALMVLHLLLALPLAWMVWAAVNDALGANPAEALSRASGDWTLRLLCCVLFISPWRALTRMPEWLRFRRSLGVACFLYACVHVLCYAWFDQGFDIAAMARDLVKRPFIWVGMLAWVVMWPLAITSNNLSVRHLGAQRWQRLHRWVYALPPLALLHFYWMRAGKNNFAEVWVYTAVLGVLMGWRIWRWVQTKRSPRI